MGTKWPITSIDDRGMQIGFRRQLGQALVACRGHQRNPCLAFRTVLPALALLYQVMTLI